MYGDNNIIIYERKSSSGTYFPTLGNPQWLRPYRQYYYIIIISLPGGTGGGCGLTEVAPPPAPRRCHLVIANVSPYIGCAVHFCTVPGTGRTEHRDRPRVSSAETPGSARITVPRGFAFDNCKNEVNYGGDYTKDVPRPEYYAAGRSRRFPECPRTEVERYGSCSSVNFHLPS